MPATIEAAKAGATTGEWAGVLRDVFGDYRAPTGVSARAAALDGDEIAAHARSASTRSPRRSATGCGSSSASPASTGTPTAPSRSRSARATSAWRSIYQGIRLTPEQIAASAIQEDVDVVGLSILSGSHLWLVPEIVRLLREQGVDVPVVVGGIIPAADAERLRADGRRRRLHAEGLRPQPDHGRDRRAGRRARRREAASPA